VDLTSRHLTGKERDVAPLVLGLDRADGGAHDRDVDRITPRRGGVHLAVRVRDPDEVLALHDGPAPGAPTSSERFSGSRARVTADLRVPTPERTPLPAQSGRGPRAPRGQAR